MSSLSFSPLSSSLSSDPFAEDFGEFTFAVNTLAELVGARATASRHGFDRYWRNVRVHTLHDPLDYRHQSIGAWLLAGDVPNPYGYG